MITDITHARSSRTEASRTNEIKNKKGRRKRLGRKPRRRKEVSLNRRRLKKVVEDVIDWTVMTRSTRQRKSQRQGVVSEGKKTSRSVERAIQILIKMDGCKTLPLEVSPNDKSR